MKGLGTILYFGGCVLILIGFLYLGITRGFTDVLGAGFLALLWVFVVLSMKTRLLKVPPGTPLPMANLRVKFNAAKMLRALLSAGLGLVWTGASTWFVHQHQWDDSWYGICLVFIPLIVFLALFVSFLVQGFAVNFLGR